MRATEIRRRFLDYFARQGHAIRESSSLVPGTDPTLLFTNAGMVQFKKVFLGMEEPPDGKRRATTSQKCVRAGGKHNDLEQVGHTARHHTFFEMLGNFSFGDYFKRDAIKFAWEFITEELKIPKEHLRVTVFYEDDEARALWREITGIPDSRIYGLGHADNFWQMADTGPCGPCTEIYVDLAHLAKDFAFPAGATGEWTDTSITDYAKDAFVEGAEAGRFLEIWNLVFMQYDRQPDGVLQPLPKPSVDTGAGLERIAAVMQGVSNNFHCDLFAGMLETVSTIVGKPYDYAREDSASYRVLADHARATAFLLADGVFPSNDGRGYVLRRILRRAVRHAWLLGRREPTLVYVVQKVIDEMRDVFPELHVRH
ncbi:MAG: alanine--tRNA ligase-related protein, partial [Gemmatimonadetes bacterium]|nr:alanine--tRNA ligase-related protein [Gemmatimonadota bacterium]